MLSQAATKDPAMSGQLDYERVDGDFYPTPPENLYCLAHFVELADLSVWEPACGEGHLSKPLRSLCRGVVSTDLYDRGFGRGGVDFFKASRMPPVLLGGYGLGGPAIITNPPYTVAEQFVRHSLELTRPHGGLVAMFLRNEWDMSCEDRPDLFEGHPAYAMKVCVTKRPRWVAGTTGSPRHNYAWYVWDWSKPADQHATIRYIHPRDARPVAAMKEAA